ncbi:hypothetical protein QWY99_14050 [Flavobacterium branchiarum]|uniref:Lipoprotein n=1 Tax=Flavobacterium branchiarum TaxID=1114870 RepID=A0ABV5FII7_9FLAO|nr:hypothetical protein [Flavobacterium branchiarum]MDN3674181.1 hypothetical protein [Flavobacterium branchiarum]
MKKAILNILSYSLSLFILLVYSCSTEEMVTNQTLDAQTWFKKYEAESPNFDIFQNLEYNWSQAKRTTSEDGTETIIVPIVERKRNASEIWKQNLYLYKISENNYEALIFEIFPDISSNNSSQSIDGGDFNGYISSWNLKNGFIKVAKFENNKVIQEGIVAMLSPVSNNEQSKMIASPCSLCLDEEEPKGGGGSSSSSPAIPLRDVVITSPSSPPTFPPMTYIPRGPSFGGVTNPSEYTNPPHGSGGGGGTTGNTENPCDQIKKQNTNPNFKAKQDELSKKTKLKKETGYLENKDRSFTALTNLSSDSMKLPHDANTIGYMHTHLDDYDTGTADLNDNPIINRPIKMFSPADVQSFMVLLVKANKNGIPLSDIYGTMISSKGNYTLRLEDSYSNLNLGLNFKELNEKYETTMRKSNSKERGFLKFMKENNITGISLFKINNDGTTDKKTLDAKDKLTTTPCP